MRPDLLNPLFAEVTVLKGVGPAMAKPLERLKLSRVVDVAFHLPTGWIDRCPRDELDMADAGRVIAIQLTAVDYKSSAGRGPTRAHAVDAKGNYVSLVYFGGHSGWVKKLLPLGEPRFVSGKLELYGQELQIVHPDIVVPPEEASTVGGREAIYPQAEGINSKRLAAFAAQAIERAPDLPEWIEPSLKAKHGWPGWREALANIHADPADEKARARLAYDEVFANQLALLLVRGEARSKRGRTLVGDGRLRDRLDLPYSPTGAQSRSIGEIEGDMAQNRPMLRLLQGDVGSGKTLVATMALLIAVEGGAQGALLAPTEILARQHYETLSRTLTGIATVAILTGRDKGRVRESTLMGLADGSIDILIGTHAIFQDSVTYKALGLVVVDEQHRFGVAQRMLLQAKAAVPPHLLVMTATPIPRTLTLAQYGEMDVSRLDEMPPGRQPIETRVLSEERLAEVVEALGRHLEGGGQAYWVCPLVEESETSDMAAAEMRAETLRRRFGDAAVALVHGRMKPLEKDAEMARFSEARAGVLVATTVIEVGVDVPNATLIVIEHADRFGLAQLHQLRGRVGRGGGKSVCLLLRGGTLSETSRARLALMRESNDGFRIAEEDLRLRGSGELLGTRQSGEMTFRLAAPEMLGELLPPANSDARLLVDRDGGLSGERGQAARVALYLFERDAAVGLLRSG
ncbi:ATP-dependent DNA helicase RecG [Sphingomonas qomolangmaensis]|uniref:ATP-dependent DNA helicase RecG n=1 Tax=Sphingomonas qomolangmaensis TaxID=2918765 RepID=A0ABY5LCT3_9SPHN|nr:ATP-dependent DNA helicase RecG [Sphingomonas qomolangmaensis]UUL83599.1 ATP-dependent DNA helicase RecG [Sphingomonas qomolangmaensis]